MWPFCLCIVCECAAHESRIMSLSDQWLTDWLIPSLSIFENAYGRHPRGGVGAARDSRFLDFAQFLYDTYVHEYIIHIHKCVYILMPTLYKYLQRSREKRKSELRVVITNLELPLLPFSSDCTTRISLFVSSAAIFWRSVTSHFWTRRKRLLNLQSSLMGLIWTTTATQQFRFCHFICRGARYMDGGLFLYAGCLWANGRNQSGIFDQSICP